MRDITERKRAEERVRLVVEAAPNAMVMVNHDGKIVLVKAQTEKLFGYARDELLGQSVEMLVPESYRAGHVGLRRDFSAHGQMRLMGSGKDFYAQRKDGKQFMVDIALNPIESPEGTWVISSIVDLTFDRQRLESIGVLANGIAHDFNNLLGSILVDSDLALEELNSGSPPVEELGRIKMVAIRAAEIIRQLMNYAGCEKAEFEPVDVSPLLEEMVELLKVSISKQATLKADLGENLPPVLGNAAQIRQVVMNLIINASQAIAEKGTIHLATSLVTGGQELAPHSVTKLAQASYICLEVSDTGRGMTQEELARIFDPYFTTKFAGRGLGLAVVQGIVHAHSGVIHVVSTPGIGTTFQVFLPCSAVPKQRRVTPSAARHDRFQSASTCVLLVEDEEPLRVAVAKILRRNGFSIVEAGDGSARLSTCARAL
jgi:PAS domain S-box-containing protein